MRIEGYIVCPIHGEQNVIVENKPITVLRRRMQRSFRKATESKTAVYTAQCPKCKKRLIVKYK